MLSFHLKSLNMVLADVMYHMLQHPPKPCRIRTRSEQGRTILTLAQLINVFTATCRKQGKRKESIAKLEDP